MNQVPPYARNTGMVFQNYALWPHLTVYENVEYGLRLRRFSPAERRRRVMAALETVHLAEYADQNPNQLSGGQQQRVALARALVIEPDVLLLDEPLSNLDAKLRLEMRGEIKRLHAATGVTALYVTHDQEEALSLADRLAVMNAGHIEQIGTPREVYLRPANRFVAGFIGEANFLEGKVEQVSNGECQVDTAIGPLWVRKAPPALRAGQGVTCCIRPEALTLQRSGHPSEAVNRFPARLEQVTYRGQTEECYLTVADVWPAKAVRYHPGDSLWEIGGAVAVEVGPQDVVLLVD